MKSRPYVLYSAPFPHATGDLLCWGQEVPPSPCLPCSLPPTLLGKGLGSLNNEPDPDSEHAEKGLALHPTDQHQETCKRRDCFSLGGGRGYWPKPKHFLWCFGFLVLSLKPPRPACLLTSVAERSGLTLERHLFLPSFPPGRCHYFLSNPNKNVPKIPPPSSFNETENPKKGPQFPQ